MDYFVIYNHLKYSPFTQAGEELQKVFLNRTEQTIRLKIKRLSKLNMVKVVSHRSIPMGRPINIYKLVNI